MSEMFKNCHRAAGALDLTRNDVNPLRIIPSAKLGNRACREGHRRDGAPEMHVGSLTMEFIEQSKCKVLSIAPPCAPWTRFGNFRLRAMVNSPDPACSSAQPETFISRFALLRRLPASGAAGSNCHRGFETTQRDAPNNLGRFSLASAEMQFHVASLPGPRLAPSGAAPVTTGGSMRLSVASGSKIALVKTEIVCSLPTKEAVDSF
jgi:hypothetical protein